MHSSNHLEGRGGESAASRLSAAARRISSCRSLVATMLVVACLAFTAGGCGSSSKSSSSSSSSGGSTPSQSSAAGSGKKIHFAKTKFALHAGLAFGAFHRYIYKPLKAGDFKHPTQHKAALAKAAVAAAFAYHELKIALTDAQSSPTLSKLVSPLTALHQRLTDLHGQLKGGHFDPSQIDQVNGQISNLHQQSAGAGAKITERSPTL